MVSPAVSSRPKLRFMFWIAWPAAPLTMLSMAEMAMKVPVRLSTNRDTSQKLL